MPCPIAAAHRSRSWSGVASVHVQRAASHCRSSRGQPQGKSAKACLTVGVRRLWRSCHDARLGHLDTAAPPVGPRGSAASLRRSPESSARVNSRHPPTYRFHLAPSASGSSIRPNHSARTVEACSTFERHQEPKISGPLISALFPARLVDCASGGGSCWSRTKVAPACRALTATSTSRRRRTSVGIRDASSASTSHGRSISSSGTSTCARLSSRALATAARVLAHRPLEARSLVCA